MRFESGATSATDSADAADAGLATGAKLATGATDAGLAAGATGARMVTGATGARLAVGATCEPDLALLQACALFEGIAAPDITPMLDCLGAQQRSFAKGAFIYRMGESITYVGIVLSGSVHVLQEDYWGNRTIVAHIDPGGVFGEALACAQIAKLPVSVMAACDAVTLQIDYRRIITTCSSACSFHARLVRNMIGILAHNNVRLTQKMGHITQRTTREKLLSYLSAQAQQAQRSIFDIPFNRQELAEYLSVDRSALSNELSKMQRDHLLTYTRNHFELC